MSRFRRHGTTPAPPPVIPPLPDGVLQICHPDWRGVRASALAFRDPIVEVADLTALIPVVGRLGADVVVIQGWPPGAGAFARAADSVGIRVSAVSHAAPTQHGVDAGEAEALTEALALADEGVIGPVGVVKAGLAEPLTALGHRVVHVPNRVPDVSLPTEPPAWDGTPVGIFLFPMWRKNVATQVLAAAELGWTPHLMADPSIGYLRSLTIEVHGELPRPRFLEVFASMRMNFNVTLSECHPMMPMESYRLGVPCLMSRTSDLFADDPELYELTTVAESDAPHAIASAALHLDGDRERAISLANARLDAVDAIGAAAWNRFTRG